MQFTIFAATAALALGANAQERMGQFRVFSAEGCSDQNQGIYTVDTADQGVCHDFNGVGAPVRSVMVEQQKEGALCTISLFTDTTCGSRPALASPNQCQNQPQQVSPFGSYLLLCDNGIPNDGSGGNGGSGGSYPTQPGYPSEPPSQPPPPAEPSEPTEPGYPTAPNDPPEPGYPTEGGSYPTAGY